MSLVMMIGGFQDLRKRKYGYNPSCPMNLQVN